VTYILIPSKKFQKAMQKCRRSGRKDVLSSFDEVGALLSVFNAPARFVLREQWKDHDLKGSMKGVRELHLSFDAVVLYRVHDKERVIALLNVINHEELEKLSSR